MLFGKVRILLAAAGLATLFLAVSAPAGQAAQNSVTGTGRHLGADPPFPVIRVHVTARSNPGGLNARGRMYVDASGFHRYRGTVTCLNVIGNVAIVGIVITRSSNPSFIGLGQQWTIADLGSPGDSDSIAGYPLTATPPDCAPQFFTVPVVSGNYTVHNAAP
jgi:hypothetical protein